MRSLVLTALILTCTVTPSVAADVSELSFEERLRAQAAIDHFYASHREGSRRNLTETAPADVTERKVLRYLRQTTALERFWNRTLTAEALEAELQRMTSQSRDRTRLRELFAIFENDSNRIREMLVRPIVVERAIRSAFKHSPPLEDSGAKSTLDFDAWWSSVEHSITDWSTANLPGTPSIPDRKVRIEPVAPTGPATTLSSVDDFHWRDSVFDAIARRKNVTVWTGTELIIWGGNDTVDDLNTGMRYDPLLDTSIPTSVDGAPEPRSYAKAVWTGAEMIVWGGTDASGGLSSGGRYDPATDTWTPVSQFGAPIARAAHSAVWTGTEMIVWGGSSSMAKLDTGGRYDPATDQWTPTNTTAAPTARSSHTAIWTGTEMIVWGGAIIGGRLQTGGRYDPSTDSWVATAVDASVPRERSNHTAVWTGTEMIVWGGHDSSSRLASGGRYDPSTNQWTSTSIQGATLSSRYGHSAVWTGNRMIVWGGQAFVRMYDGALYDPLTDNWSPVTDLGAPTPRDDHAAVWTGSEMLVFGGFNPSIRGGRYDPASDQWGTFTIGVDVPEFREHSAVWTGVEMLFWGLDADPAFGGEPSMVGGFRYDPTLDVITPIPTTGAPTSGLEQAAVWTGDEMIVWGGSACPALSTGARYDPWAETWSAMSTNGAPEGGMGPTAAWTGDRMLIWSGRTSACDEIIYDPDTGLPIAYCPYPASVTGALYDPLDDSWQAIPDPPLTQRDGYAAAWTGTDLVVWGGRALGCGSVVSFDDGARYNLLSNSWIPISNVGAPPAEWRLVSGWTGDEMVVWVTGTSGARYDPAADEWAPVSGIDAPQSECNTAVWTGDELMIWGLDLTDPDYGSGRRYDPVLDQWIALPTENAVHPECSSRAPRPMHTAVWTGTEMVVVGPSFEASFPRGSVLAPMPQDSDGDGRDDARDNCLMTPNPSQADADRDGAGDACDPCPADRHDDADADGLCADVDNCPTDANPLQTDTDGDTLGDVCDPCPFDPLNDADFDAVCDGSDNCLALANPGQEDVDGDTVGDACDNCVTAPNTTQTNADFDAWGDVCDNCPELAHSSQADSDADGVGDACDNCIAAPNPDQFNADRYVSRRWAASATASSEWSATDWSASQAVGPPELMECNSVATNWSPLERGVGAEWLELGFATPGRPIGVDIYESGLESGFVQRIEARDTGGTLHTVWQGTDPMSCGEVFTARWPSLPYDVTGFVVHTQTDGWEEIDAIEMVGVTGLGPDSLGSACDVCPFVRNYDQADRDGDGAGDICDCAPDDPLARGPSEIGGVLAVQTVPGVVTLSWPVVTAANEYSVSRGRISQLAVGQYGACVRPGGADPWYDDDVTPPAGDGFFYLIQGINDVCGAGTAGAGGDGDERANMDPAACSP